MKYLALLATLVASLLFQLPAQARTVHAAKAYPITIVDDHQNVVTFKTRPKRLLPIDPRDTETLFALGLESRVVGDGGHYVEGAAGLSRPFHYPSEWPSPWGRDYPVRAKTLTHIEGGCCGTPFNLETIVSLHPDVVFVPYSATEVPTFTKLHDLGIKVVVLDPSNLTGILHDITLVAKITGTTSRARIVTTNIRAQVARVRARVRGVAHRPRVYYEIDATNPTQPFTAGRGTFIDEALTIAGGTNVARAASTCRGTLCYPQFSLEALVRLNPQIILLADGAYGESAATVRQRGGWGTISAVRTGKIYPFNDELLSRAGPRIGIGIAAIAHLVHPEAFKKK